MLGPETIGIEWWLCVWLWLYILHSCFLFYAYVLDQLYKSFDFAFITEICVQDEAIVNYDAVGELS